MPPDLNKLSATEAAHRIAAGSLTSEALVAACLERIAAREPEVQAWACLDPDLALRQARERDREPPRGPAHGIPFGIKDIIDTADMPTEYGSPIYRGHRPRADAACVALIRRAGGIILGKTVTTEFAHNHPGKTRNPHRLDHTPGGSSSGSGAAVADFMVPLALGTQTGGSVIRPGAFCGVVACKPSFNSINRAGIKFAAESLDTIGVYGRSPEDAALALHVLSGRALPDFSRSLGKPRIGLCRTSRWLEAEPGTRSAVEDAAARLSRAGARVDDFEMPADCARLFDEHAKIMNYESARALAWEFEQHPGDISDNLRARIEAGLRESREGYDAVQALARQCRRQFGERMRDCDFLVTPSAPGVAPPTLASTGSSLFNRVWTLLGVPCVTLPVGADPRGLPLAVQLIGPYEGDMGLLAWAHWAANALR
jgi:Asp-tRNA(Asn)/Glu-tRNA(Gln) amidotransferase A subunit family amidase